MARHMLLARTALAGTAALLATSAAALPGFPDAVAFNTGGGAPIVTNPNAATLDIDFNAARTVLQFNGFDITNTDTVNLRFDARSDIGIIHNTGQEALRVDGILQSFVGAEFGGNVWLLSSSGVLFGANAQVDVGGLLAATALPANLLDPNGPVLDPTNLSFDFSGGLASIATTGGGRITGHGGTLAFVAPAVSTSAGTIIGGGGDTSVLYGAAESYLVRFVREAGNDLDLLDFEVPGLAAGGTGSLPLQISGTTSAGNIYLAAVSQVATVGSILLAAGNLTATSASLEGGNIVLTAGSGIANRAAAPLFTDGAARHVISASGFYTADRNVTIQATGDITLPGAVDAGGVVAITGVSLNGGTLAGQDIVLRAGDAIGSTGTGSGYGVYEPQGGNIAFASATAGDDLVATAWDGNIAFDTVVLAGIGPDTQGDPLGLLDAAGDGRRLLLRTTGSFGDILLGGLDTPTDALTGGTETQLDAAGGVRVRSTGGIALTAVEARGGTAHFKTDGALTVGAVDASGLVLGDAGGAVQVGSASATRDDDGNASVVLRGASVMLASASATNDVMVISDNGDATVGDAVAGDDIIVRARGGTAQLRSATIMLGEGFNFDRDANQFFEGDGFTLLFEGLNVDAANNGRLVDLGSLTLFAGEGGGGTAVGGDVRLGLGTGSVTGADAILVDAQQDAFVDLVPDTALTNVFAGRDAFVTAASLTVDALSAGRDVVATARTGDLTIETAGAGRDLSLLAAAGLVQFGAAELDQDLLIDARGVRLGSVFGTGNSERARDITITVIDDLTIDRLETNRDLKLSTGGSLDALNLSAFGTISVSAAAAATFGVQDGRQIEPLLAAGVDLTISAATIDIRPGAQASANRDVTLTATTRVGIDRAVFGDDVRIAAPTIAIGTLMLGEGTTDSEGDSQNIVLRGTTIDAVSLSANSVDVVALGQLGIGDPECTSECPRGVSAGDDALLKGASFRLDAPIIAGRDAVLASTTGDLDLTGEFVAADRDLILSSTGSLTLGAVIASRDVRLTAATLVKADALTAGRNATVDSTDIAVGQIDAGNNEAGDIVLTGGTVAVGLLRASQDINVTMTGAAVFGRPACETCEQTGIDASRDIVLRAASLSLEGQLSAGRDLDLTTTVSGFASIAALDAGRDLKVDAAGALTLATARAVQDVKLTGASADVALVDSGRDAFVTARSGDATVQEPRVPQDLSVLAAAGLVHIGDAGVGRDLLLSGATTTLGVIHGFVPTGYGYGTPIPTRDIVIAASAGGFAYTGLLATARDLHITVNSALFLASDATAGQDILLGGGSVQIAGLTATRDLGISARTGTLIATGTLTAGDDARFAGSDTQIAAATTTGLGTDTESDGSSIVATGGGIRIDAARAFTDLTVTAAGIADIGGNEGASAGQDISITGAMPLFGSLDAGRDLTLVATGREIAANSLDAVRHLTVTAADALSFDSASAGGDIRLTGHGIAVRDTVIAGGDATLDAGAGLLSAPLIRAGDDVRLSGAMIDVGQAFAVGNAPDGDDGGADIVATGGSIVVEIAVAASDIRVTGSGAVTLGIGADGTRTGGGGIYLAGANGDIIATGASLLTGPLDAGRDAVLTATAGDINARGTVAAGRDVRASATGAAGFTARVTAVQNIGIVAGARIGAARLDAGRDIDVTGATAALAEINALQDARIAATGSDAAVTRAAVKRDLGVTAALGLARLGDVAVGGDLTATGARLEIGSVAGFSGGYGVPATRDITLTATAGDIDGFADLTATRDLRFTASGAARLGDLVAGAAIAGLAGSALTTGNATATTIGLEAGGSLTGGTYTSTGATILAGASIDGGSVRASDIRATARSGGVTLGDLTADDDIRIVAAQDIRFREAAAQGSAPDDDADGRNIALSGGVIEFESANAQDDVLIDAMGALTTTADGTAIVAGRDARLSAGSLNFGGVSAGRDLSLTATASGIMTGNLSAARDLTLDASGALAFGDISAARDLTLAGASIAGRDAVAGGDLNAVARTGAATFGDLRADDGLAVDAAGGLVFGGADATQVTLAAASMIGGVVSAALDLNATARSGDLALAMAIAGDDARLAASGSVRVAKAYANAGRTNGDSEGDGSNVVATGSDVRLDYAFSASDLELRATGAAYLGSTTTALSAAMRDVRITGATIDAYVFAGRDIVTSGGSVVLGGLAVRDVSVTGTSLALRKLIADEPTAIQAGDDFRVDVGGGAITGQWISAGAGSVDSEGDGNNVVVRAGSITVATITAATDVILTSEGVLASGGGITAGRDALLTAASVTPAGITAGRDLSLTASASGIAAGDLSAARDLTLDASGALSFGDLTAARNLTLAGATLSGHDATAGGVITATARSGDADLRQFIGSGGLTVDARGAITIASADGLNTTLIGARVASGFAAATGDLSITARDGTLDLGGAFAGDDVRLTASGAVRVGDTVSHGNAFDSEGDGSNIVVRGSDVRVDAASAATDLDLGANGSLSTGVPVEAGRDVRLSGATIDASVVAGRDIVVTGGAVALAGEAARDIRVTATSLARSLLDNGGGLSAGDDIRIAVSGAASGVRLTADSDGSADSEADGSNVVVTAGSISLGPVFAGTDVVLTSASTLSSTSVGAGRDARLTAAALGRTSVSAARDIALTATAGDVVAGRVAAIRNLVITATGTVAFADAVAGAALTLTAASVAGEAATAGTDLTATVNGALNLAAATAGDDVRLGGDALTLGQVRATGLAADSEGDGFNVVLGGGAIGVAQASASGNVAVTGSGAVSVGQVTAAGDVMVKGASVGGALQLSGRDIAVSSGGAFAATAGLVAARDLRLTAGTTLSFASLAAARDLILTAPFVQGGSAVAARDLTVIATTRIGGERFEAGRNLILDPDEAIVALVVRAAGDATLIGRSLDIGLLDVGGTTFAQATGSEGTGTIALDSFTARGAATLLAPGKISLGSATTAALRIVGGDLDVRRGLVAASLQVETPGTMTLGGAEGTGFSLAAADIARLRVAGQASFYAGLTRGGGETGGASGDLIVRGFAYNPADLPRIALFADRGHVVDIQGKILPSVTGGFIQIGDVSLTSRFRPGSIFVSGGFGTAELDVNCFGKVVAVGELAFYAVDDVILGLADFRAAVRATAAETIDIALGSPAVAGPADDRLFAVATRFTVDAAGKIVSQNTASQPGAFVGLFFNGSGATGPVVSLGAARAIDLSGSLVDSGGTLRSGPTVALLGAFGGSGSAAIRFNGCLVDAACGGGVAGASPAEALRLEDYTPPRPVDLTDAPLSTVLLVESEPELLDILAVGSSDGSVVIRKRQP